MPGKKYLVMMLISLLAVIFLINTVWAITRTPPQERAWNDINRLNQEKLFAGAEWALKGYLKSYPDDTEAQELLKQIQGELSSEFISSVVNRCDECSKAGGQCQIEIDSTLYYLDRGDSSSAWPFYMSANSKYGKYCMDKRNRLDNLLNTSQINFDKGDYQSAVDSLNIFSDQRR